MQIDHRRSLAYPTGVSLASQGGCLSASAGGTTSQRFLEEPVSLAGGKLYLTFLARKTSDGAFGITFSNVDAKGRKKLKLTPEKCIQIQFDLGSDIMMCLDDCPRPDAGEDEVAESVQRTIKWARQCKIEFERQLEVRRLSGEERPWLFGIVQGGYSKRLRWQCAEALIDVGFDGYGFGGWPLDLKGGLAHATLAYTARLMPDELSKYALGVGNPAAIVQCVEMGYNIFDCVLPTRDARHQRLYCLAESGDPFASSFLYIQDRKHKRDPRPVSEACDCACCTRYSRGYLHHLFEIQDTLALRLATIHNLRFYVQLMDRLRSL